VWIFFGQGEEFFRCGSPHFLIQDASDFSKIMVRPHEQEGRANADILRTRVVKFLRFCADFFYGRPLTTNSQTLAGNIRARKIYSIQLFKDRNSPVGNIIATKRTEDL